MSNNLTLDQVAGSQDQKEVTINDQAGQLDAALTEALAVLVTVSNVFTLSTLQFQRAQIFVVDEDGGSPATAAITLTVPSIPRGLFTVLNNTAFPLTVEVAAQPLASPVVKAVSGLSLLYCDGTNVFNAGRMGHYDAGDAFTGSPTTSQVVFQYIFPREVTLPEDLTNSQGTAGTASTGTATFDVKKNGANVGTMVFTASTTATFTMASDTVYAAGDVLEISAPAVVDATLADLIFTLAGVL